MRVVGCHAHTQHCPSAGCEGCRFPGLFSVVVVWVFDFFLMDPCVTMLGYVLTGRVMLPSAQCTAGVCGSRKSFLCRLLLSLSAKDGLLELQWSQSVVVSGSLMGVPFVCAKISEILKLHETLFHEQPVLAFELAEGSFTRPI